MVEDITHICLCCILQKFKATVQLIRTRSVTIYNTLCVHTHTQSEPSLKNVYIYLSYSLITLLNSQEFACTVT